MSAASWAWFLLAVVASAVDWWSRARPHRAVEWVAKPLATAAFLAAAVALQPVDPGMRAWFLAGFALALVGDVALLAGRFVPGLVAFLAAQVAFAVGFTNGGADQGWVWLGAVVLLVALPTVGRRIVEGAGEASGPLALAVAVYLAGISAMVLAAFAHGEVVGILAALSFYVSDAILGWDRFVRRQRFAPVAIMVTYHLALAGFVLTLVRSP